MLTEKEKEGFREILQTICQDDLIALKDTVSNRQISAQNRSDAIQAILTYTDNAVQLFKRRKLKRDSIFKYLARHQVPVSTNADKSTLIRTVLAYWGTTVNQEADRQLLELAEAMEVDDEEVVTQDPHSVRPATPPLPFAQQLAKQFVQWFFQQLNALNPNSAQGDVGSQWGPQMFFNDCRLKIHTQCQDSRTSDEFQGADIVSERFRSLVQSEGFLFNPNIGDGGTKGVNDPHGLVLVFVCGILHKEGLCIGVFEQRFGLVRDPLNDNNWKIKFTDMNLKSESVNRIPRLKGDVL